MKFVVCPSSLEYSLTDSSFVTSFLFPLIDQNRAYQLILDKNGKLLDEYKKIAMMDKSSGLVFWLKQLDFNKCYKNHSSEINEISALLLLDLSRKQFNLCDRNIVTSNEEGFTLYKEQIANDDISIIEPSSKILMDESNLYKDSEIRDLLLIFLQDMIAKIQSKKLEDLHNDVLVLGLRSNGYKRYDVHEQAREGKSKGGGVGELDILVKDRVGSRRAIIEALRSKSCGEKDNDISYHLNKLLNDYNQVGIKINYLVVYCEAKDFSGYWEKYCEYIRKINNKPNFSGETPLVNFKDTRNEISDVTGIKVAISRHKKDGLEVDVYHIVCKFYSP